MPKQSIFYRYPSLYIFWLKHIHGRNFNKRYHYMASLVRSGETVLEPGCGPAILAQFLSSKNKYVGFDTNKQFLAYARAKKIKVYYGNVLDHENYQPSDVVIVCDVLHHLKPKERKEFVSNCFRNCKRLLILCDPGQKEESRGSLSPLFRWLTEWSEQDGTGNFSYEDFMSSQKLIESINNGFGAIPQKVKRSFSTVGEDIIAVYQKKL